jgi:hypothetical protein
VLTAPAHTRQYHPYRRFCEPPYQLWPLHARSRALRTVYKPVIDRISAVSLTRNRYQSIVPTTQKGYHNFPILDEIYIASYRILLGKSSYNVAIVRVIRSGELQQSNHDAYSRSLFVHSNAIFAFGFRFLRARCAFLPIVVCNTVVNNLPS